jgi:hypothetical protein
MLSPQEALVVRSSLTCIECGRAWLLGRERWRLKVLDENPPETVPYCPDCAQREFDE